MQHLLVRDGLAYGGRTGKLLPLDPGSRETHLILVLEDEFFNCLRFFPRLTHLVLRTDGEPVDLLYCRAQYFTHNHALFPQGLSLRHLTHVIIHEGIGREFVSALTHTRVQQLQVAGLKEDVEFSGEFFPSLYRIQIRENCARFVHLRLECMEMWEIVCQNIYLTIVARFCEIVSVPDFDVNLVPVGGCLHRVYRHKIFSVGE